MPDARKSRNEQCRVLMQLAMAVRGPAGLGPLADRLEEISNEALVGLMERWYDPVQLVQAVGGSEAEVRARANKLLDRITAGDLAQAGLGA
jgi:hypothetical protein